MRFSSENPWNYSRIRRFCQGKPKYSYGFCENHSVPLTGRRFSCYNSSKVSALQKPYDQPPCPSQCLSNGPIIPEPVDLSRPLGVAWKRHTTWPPDFLGSCENLVVLTGFLKNRWPGSVRIGTQNGQVFQRALQKPDGSVIIHP